jgi:protein-S-isoprenylcysteine O-methyltransferase Ste14
MILEFLLFTFFYIYLFIYLFFLTKSTTYSPLFELGTFFSFIGLLLAFRARLQLRSKWSPITKPTNPNHLINTGAFKVLRHPIYVGRFMFFFGVMLMLNPLGIVISIFYFLLLAKKSKDEEAFLLKTNPKYLAYSKKTIGFFF